VHLSVSGVGIVACDEISHEGGIPVYGVFGGYTRWAVVFLIIFVLFFLFVPVAGAAVAGGPGVAMTSYQSVTDISGHYMDGPSYMGGTSYMGYDGESSS
jgi:hypothetical protein